MQLCFCGTAVSALSQYSKVDLGPYQTSILDIFRENTKQLAAVNYLRQKYPLWMCDRVLNEFVSNFASTASLVFLV